MSTGLALLSLAALAAVAVAAWVARARRLARRARRLAALSAVAEQVDAALAGLKDLLTPSSPKPRRPAGPPPDAPPLIGDTLPGRAALVDVLCQEVDRAGADGSRLTAAVVEATTEVDGELGVELRATANAQVYLVGPRAVALVLPGFGRAAALGVLARIQAAHGLDGRVVELEPGENAVELAARLLGPPPDA